MWQRILRLLGTGINAYSFFSNPVRFIISIMAIIVVPYLAYIFWGVVVIIALAVLGIYLIYKAITASNNQQYHY